MEPIQSSPTYTFVHWARVQNLHLYLQKTSSNLRVYFSVFGTVNILRSQHNLSLTMEQVLDTELYLRYITIWDYNLSLA